MSSKWWAMTAVSLGVFMATLDVSIVNISLPTLVKELQTDFATIQWVILGYVLILTSLTLGVGRLADILGRKKLYMTGQAIFTVSSLLCGLAPSVGWLIAFRIMQGLGAVMMQALGAAIITEVFPPSERGRALGTIGGVVSMGLAFGPPLGGLLIGLGGWRWIFLVNVPLGLITIYCTWRHVPASTQPGGGQRFDLAGGVLMLITLASYALGMTLGQNRGFTHWLTLLLLGLAGAGLVSFVVVERNVSQPMINLSLFRNVILSLNLLMGFLVFLTLALSFILPFFLELVKHCPTQQVGLLMMVMPLCMGLVAPWSGWLSDRFGSRGLSLLGLLILVGACWSISTLKAEVTTLGYIVRIIPMGVGMGLFQSPNSSSVMGQVPRQNLGVASSLLVLVRTLGHTSGIPLAGAIFTLQVQAVGHLPGMVMVIAAPPEALVGGLARTALIMGTFALIAAVLAAVALWLDRQ